MDILLVVTIGMMLFFLFNVIHEARQAQYAQINVDSLHTVT